MNPSPRTTRRQLLQRAASAAALGVAAPALLGGCAGRDPAPDFTYTGLDGKPGNTQALRGKVVLVNFWATSCVTCVAEMPQLMATHDKYKARGYDTLAVAMSYDPPAYVSRFAESRKLPFGVVIDNTGAIAKAYGDVSITPTTFLLDKKGAVVKRYVGQPDFAALHGLIEKLLAEA